MINSKKRVSLNRRISSLHLEQDAMLSKQCIGNDNSNVNDDYTRQLAATALSVSPTALKLKDSPTEKNVMEKKLEFIPRLLKSSLRTPNKSASAPCSPTHLATSKTVQFHPTRLEHICLFRKAQTPSAISSRKQIFWADNSEDEEDEDDSLSSSSSSSDEDDEQIQIQEQKTELVHVNWPSNHLSDIIDRKNKMVRVEKNGIYLSDEKDRIIGKIAVRNVDYHKTVNIRYTFDFWNTVNNIEAQFHEGHKTFDVFVFNISLPTTNTTTNTTMYFAVNYKVGQQEYWDNNSNRNYELQILRQNTNRLKKTQNKPIMMATTTAKKKPFDLDDITNKKLTKNNTGFLSRYDFTKSIESAKSTNKPTSSAAMHTSNHNIPVFRKTPFTSPTTPVSTVQTSPLSTSATIPVPIRNTSSAVSLSLSNSPANNNLHYSTFAGSTSASLSSSPSATTFTDLNSQSYLDLVNKYCFYSTSPSRSPMSING
ncbi:putative phosphatase regulatory subunit-domain-containing protein [Mycotypha africana]|uniref:putative phosphatase regulatory subunit-domain-containing protein n=1 Tax=Mycotypha africana TaxID=64632 RepID=UPI0023018915|nr:putative phosphatase regulatory subunit-domain-containing protein [Mycotypha africana]KAI8971795.1 putative phosphatase regulatory subunit-domain-containing protein [Mycotypha africana]